MLFEDRQAGGNGEMSQVGKKGKERKRKERRKKRIEEGMEEGRKEKGGFFVPGPKLCSLS